MKQDKYERYYAYLCRLYARKTPAEIRAIKSFIRHFVFEMTPEQVLKIIKTLVALERIKTKKKPSEKEEFEEIMKGGGF